MLGPSSDSPGAVLRGLMSKGSVMLPGVFNGISALSATKQGASALYISGAGITNGTLGVPDIGLASLDEFAYHAQCICSVVSVPVISDIDTGFGEAWNVAKTITKMEAAGLAGIHIEDQVNPKRCGHLEGKSVISIEAMQEKIRAAVQAKKDPTFLIIARTDARSVERLDSAIERASAYVDSGADAVFPEGLQSKEEFAQFRAAVKVPLLANMTEFGKTPIISFQEFEALHYEMVIYPMTAFRVMLKAIDEAYDVLIKEGTQANLLPRMRTRQELYEVLNYSAYDELGKKWQEPNQ